MAVRIRYRVESAGRFRSHVHFVDGTGYFFYPGRTAGKGQRVTLEVTFDVTGESIVLHGSVWANPRATGMWLELPGAGKALEWADVFSRRMEHRVPTEQLVLVQAEGKPALLCRLGDVSSGGARLAAAPADIGAPGDRVRISLPEAGPGGVPLDAQAFVAWTAEGELGVTWLRSDLRTRIAAARLVEIADFEWDDSAEAAHALACRCGGNNPQPLVLLG